MRFEPATFVASLAVSVLSPGTDRTPSIQRGYAFADAIANGCSRFAPCWAIMDMPCVTLMQKAETTVASVLAGNSSCSIPCCSKEVARVTAAKGFERLDSTFQSKVAP